MAGDQETSTGANAQSSESVGHGTVRMLLRAPAWNVRVTSSTTCFTNQPTSRGCRRAIRGATEPQIAAIGTSTPRPADLPA